MLRLTHAAAPRKPGGQPMDILEKLGNRILMDDGCWEWDGAHEKQGYGCLRHNGKTLKAHRVSYETYVGPIPEGLELDHLCSNRGCVRPDHLEPVTHGENVRRGKRWVQSTKL